MADENPLIEFDDNDANNGDLYADEKCSCDDNTDPKLACSSYDANLTSQDDNLVNSSAVQLYMEGSSWPVTYYNQILGKDSSPQGQSLSLDAPYQQYRKISDFELKVTAPLSYDYAENNGISGNTGSGYIMGVIKPNTGDIFIADLGNGTNGVFEVTRAARQTFMKQSVYAADWKQVTWLNGRRQADLDRKTIDSLVFNKDSMLNGCGPFLSEEENEQQKSYGDWFDDLMDSYLGDFFSADKGTLLMPDQGMKTYDHFLVGFFRKVFMGEHPDVGRIHTFNMYSDHLLNDSRTLWDAFFNRRKYYLKSGIQHAMLTDTSLFSVARPDIQNICWMGIPYVVSPVETSSNVDDRYVHFDIFLRNMIPYQPGTERRRDTFHLDPPQYQEQDYFTRTPDTSALIRPITEDDFYVFGAPFYKDKAGTTMIEQLAKSAINREKIDRDKLNKLLLSSLDWPTLERFYYVPVLLYLLLIITRNMDGAS